MLTVVKLTDSPVDGPAALRPPCWCVVELLQGSIQFVSNVVFVRFVLGETVTRKTVLATCVIVGASTNKREVDQSPSRAGQRCSPPQRCVRDGVSLRSYLTPCSMVINSRPSHGAGVFAPCLPHLRRAAAAAAVDRRTVPGESLERAGLVNRIDART